MINSSKEVFLMIWWCLALFESGIFCCLLLFYFSFLFVFLLFLWFSGMHLSHCSVAFWLKLSGCLYCYSLDVYHFFSLWHDYVKIIPLEGLQCSLRYSFTKILKCPQIQWIFSDLLICSFINIDFWLSAFRNAFEAQNTTTSKKVSAFSGENA